MKKLQLELNDLQVESFETIGTLAGRGTVEAHISPRCGTNFTCDAQANTCGDADTCGANPSCYLSCNTNCPLDPCGGGGGGSWDASDCAECQTEPVTFCGAC